MFVVIIAVALLAALVAIAGCKAEHEAEEQEERFITLQKRCDGQTLRKLHTVTDSGSKDETIPQGVFDWMDMEEACEGKTIRTLSCNEVGVIIRFTDGSSFTQMNGITQYKEAIKDGTSF